MEWGRKKIDAGPLRATKVELLSGDGEVGRLFSSVPSGSRASRDVCHRTENEPTESDDPEPQPDFPPSATHRQTGKRVDKAGGIDRIGQSSGKSETMQEKRGSSS